MKKNRIITAAVALAIMTASFVSGNGAAHAADTQSCLLYTSFCRGQKVSFCRSPGELESITAKSIAECADKGEEDALEIYKK